MFGSGVEETRLGIEIESFETGSDFESRLFEFAISSLLEQLDIDDSEHAVVPHSLIVQSRGLVEEGSHTAALVERISN